MLKVKGITAGKAGVAYLVRGCAGHEHTPESYYLKGAEMGPVGRWGGNGVTHLGLSAGAAITEAQAETILGLLCDPRKLPSEYAKAATRIAARLAAEPGADKKRRAEIRGEEMETAERAARLGREPMKFKSFEERFAARLEREGIDGADGTQAERIAELKADEHKKDRKAIGYFDATFSPEKSISLLHAGYLECQRGGDAALVVAAHHEGVAAAQAYLQEHAGYSRAGYHSQPEAGRPSVGRYIDAKDWVMAEFDHYTNREGEPQLHTHMPILNRTLTVDADGSEHWRTLDSKSLHKLKAAAGAIYERTMEGAIERDLPVTFAMRPDGKSRELLGITAAERDAFSSRRVQIKGRLAEYVESYKERHGGAEPSRYQMTLLAEQAWQDTRRSKEKAEPVETLAARWEEMAQKRLGSSLRDIVERAEEASRQARVQGTNTEFDREQVIAVAVGAVQKRMADWTRSDLVAELNRALPDQLRAGTKIDGLLEELATQALRPGGQVVQVDGFELIAPPEALRRASDGKSIYRPGHDERYATTAHLAAEERIVALAHARGGTALHGEIIEGVIEQAGLSGDQAAAVRGVLGDGRKLSTIVGPAGTGKSYIQSVIASAWSQHSGGRVIGLGPSAVAAEVLSENGVRHTVNTARFLMYAEGKGEKHELERFALHPGDLVVVDEAAMTSTDHLLRISALAERAGAKVTFVGDDAQLASVEAGGAFRLVRDAGTAYELDTVRRFKDADGSVREWEAAASLKIREGDARALGAYESHGRILGGTLQEMNAQARDAYVADVLAGRDAVVMTGTAERAAQLSADIRERLVGFGLVEEEGVTLGDHTFAGVGDLIRTRQNEQVLRDSDGRVVLNRRSYRVEARHEDGSLSVRHVAGRDEDGREVRAGVVRLPAAYVAEHVELGYAGTIHAAQGRTVQHGYAIADDKITREQLYVMLTRGAASNKIFVESHREADEHRIEGLDRDPRAVLADALERECAEKAALTTLRESQEHVRKLSSLAPIWSDVVETHTRARYDSQLQTLLGEDEYARLRGENTSALQCALRNAEVSGHNPQQVLAEIVAQRGLADAEEITATLTWRLQRHLAARVPETAPAGETWLSRTPADLEGPIGEYARTYAKAMDERRSELGEQAAVEPPAWALSRLGPVPEETSEREAWTARAAQIAAYREQYHIQDETSVLGAVPAHGATWQRAEWDAAHTALGADQDAVRLAGMSETDLHERVLRWKRETIWAPAYVDVDLARAKQAQARAEQQALFAQAEAERTQETNTRDEHLARAAAHQALADAHTGRAAKLERIHQARAAWYAETTPAREESTAAQNELARRQPEPDNTPDAGMQHHDDAPLNLDAEYEHAKRAQNIVAERTRTRDTEDARRRQERENTQREMSAPAPSLEFPRQ